MLSVTYLVGPPASGKRTIGQELSAMTGAALIDNHLINDPLFTAYGADGYTPLPEWVWELVASPRCHDDGGHTRGVLPAPPDALVLDTSAMSPRQAAQRIVDHADRTTGY